jgi:cytochrome b561
LADTIASRPSGYTTIQIVLHWLVAVLVLIQLFVTEGIEHAWRAFRRGTELAPDDVFLANWHVWAGITIFSLAAIRLIIRFSRGAPPPPANESWPLRAIAALTHFALYAFILLMPLSGFVAWFGIFPDAADIHELGKLPLLVLIGLHAAGALWQHFIARNDVLRRMIRARA